MATLKYKDAKFIVFSDFDGTITTEDSNDHMTDNLGYGKEKRRQGNIDILNEKVTFRDAFREMIDSVAEKHSFDHCREVVRKNIKLDPGFKDFYDWTKSVGIPVVIVSSGMEPIIRSIFSNLVGEEDANQIEIVANDVDTSKGSEAGQWTIKFRHPDSGFGHDKDRCISPYRNLSSSTNTSRPTLFYCGDGVSDMSAAKSSDCLFVKVKTGMGNDLAKHCQKDKIRFQPFESFLQVLDDVKQVVEGKVQVDKLGQVG